MSNRPFILRYQEFCIEPSIAEAPKGTQTITNVRAEAVDSDDKSRRHAAFAAAIPSGTQKATFVVAEGGDKDAQRPKHNAFENGPKKSTMSITAVRAETVDEDKNANASLAFPKRKGAISAGTQTHTRVQAEQSDNDRGRKQFEAIPQCSLS